MIIPAIAFFGKSIYDNVKSGIEFGTNIITKYFELANDKSLHDKYHEIRTIRLNVFDAGSLEFNMSPDKKSLLIYEGFSKTMKFLSKQLFIYENANIPITSNTGYFVN